MPGKWIFQVDGAGVRLPNLSINRQCRLSVLDMSNWIQNVKIVSLLGQGIFAVKNECIESLLVYDISLSCEIGNVFNSAVVPGKILDSQAICQIPVFITLGVADIAMKVIITRSGEKKVLHNSFQVSVVKNEDLGETLKIHSYLLSSILFINTTWKSGRLNLEELQPGYIQKRELALIILERLPDFTRKETLLGSHALNETLDDSFTTFTFQLLPLQIIKIVQTSSNPLLFAVQYKVWSETGTVYSKQVVSSDIAVEQTLRSLQSQEMYASRSSLKCEAWLKEDPHLSVPTLFHSSCPNTLSQATLDLQFMRDNVYSNLLQNGVSNIGVFQNVPNLHGHVVMCSYRVNGSQVFEKPSGSQIAAYNANHVLSLYSSNLLPYWYCCGSNQQTCQNYFDKRGTLPRNKYKVSVTAAVFGLAHVISFGGNQSSKMDDSTGLVWLVNHHNDKRNSFLKVQGKLKQFGQTYASILEGIAINEFVNGKIWKVECACTTNLSMLQIKIKLGTSRKIEFNSEEYSLNQTFLLYHENFHIRTHPENGIVVSSISGIAVRVIPHTLNSTCWISVVVQYSNYIHYNSSFTTTATGYLFENRGGWITNQTMKVGEHRVSANESLFSEDSEFPVQLGQENIPDTSPDDMDFKLCSNQTECSLDYLNTLDPTFAKITYSERQHIQKIMDAALSNVTYYDPLQDEEVAVATTKAFSYLPYIHFMASFVLGIVLTVVVMILTRRYCMTHQIHSPANYPIFSADENEYAEIQTPATLTVAYSRKQEDVTK